MFEYIAYSQDPTVRAGATDKSDSRDTVTTQCEEPIIDTDLLRTGDFSKQLAEQCLGWIARCAIVLCVGLQRGLGQRAAV